MGTLLTVLIIAMFSNIQNFHTHEDSSKQVVATLTQEVELFKERVSEESGKVKGLEVEVRALAQNVKNLELEVRELRKELQTRFATLTQNLIEVIKAQ